MVAPAITVKRFVAEELKRLKQGKIDIDELRAELDDEGDFNDEDAEWLRRRSPPGPPDGASLHRDHPRPFVDRRFHQEGGEGILKKATVPLLKILVVAAPIIIETLKRK